MGMGMIPGGWMSEMKDEGDILGSSFVNRR